MHAAVRFYLFLYNSLMALGWLYLFLYVMRRLNIESQRVEKEAQVRAVEICCVLQLISCLELLHVLLGLVKGSVFATIVQLVGRNHVLFCGICCLPKLWTTTSTGWLIVIWASIEIIRYPNYALNLYSLPGSGLFTWLRYTIFIPLYPLGFLTERKSIAFYVNMLLNDITSVDLQDHVRNIEQTSTERTNNGHPAASYLACNGILPHWL